MHTRVIVIIIIKSWLSAVVCILQDFELEKFIKTEM